VTVIERPVPPRYLWRLAAGFAVWCSALVALYAIHGIGCAFGWSAGTLRFWLAAALLAHMIVLGWMWRAIARAEPDTDYGPTGAFLHWAFTATLIAALVATAVTFGPPLLLATCI
jgi:hypothetical protein